MPKADDVYGSQGSIPTVENQGESNAGIRVQANANDFGGQVGQAISGAGKEAEDIGNHFAQMTAEAKVNDDYANKYVPAAAQLRSQYDSLRGQDKVAGYNNYISGLQDLNKQFTAAQPGDYGQKAMSGMIDRHVEGEIFGAKKELVTSQQAFSDQARYDAINANVKMASQNYNNPELVNSYQTQNDNHILINHIDNGVDPNSEAGKSLIEDAQKNSTGQMATGMIQNAFNNGDAVSANALRANYGNFIPGYQKLALDNTLHTQNMQITGAQTVKAFTTGQPAPEAIGAPAAQVQALVANTAKSSQVEPNDALTILRIESSNGQNLGTRGTLGQDKESAGKPIDEQAKTLCDNLKTAGTQATTALGRQAEPWEAYAVYQQGAGGGVALLKAATENPNMNAVQVLSQFYKSPKDALSAVNNNGGNSTMSASDFVDHIKQVYTDNAQRANCDFTNTDSPGQAILAPHQTTGVTVQPAASPIQSQLNFEKKVPDIINQINAIPNYDVRAGVMKAFNQDRQRYGDAATAYKNVLVNQAGQLAADPKFTSIDQIPPEMHAALAADHPQTLDYMERRAQVNLDKQGGNTTKDMKEYGAGFYDLFNQVHAIGDDPNKINSVAELQKHVGKDGDLTIAGYDRLSKEIAGKNTPDGEAEGLMKKQFFANAKQQISGKDEMLGIKDPQGEENYLRFMAQALPAYEQGKGEGKSAADLLNPDSKDYVGKSIPTFKRSISEQMADMENASGTVTPPVENKPGIIATGIHHFGQAIGAIPEDKGIDTPEGLRNAVINGKMTREEGEAEAIKRGYIKSNKPVVPLAE